MVRNIHIVTEIAINWRERREKRPDSRFFSHFPWGAIGRLMRYFRINSHPLHGERGNERDNNRKWRWCKYCIAILLFFSAWVMRKGDFKHIFTILFEFCQWSAYIQGRSWLPFVAIRTFASTEKTNFPKIFLMELFDFIPSVAAIGCSNQRWLGRWAIIYVC